ncbi:MAG: hypothetical protein Q9227_001179 [Pyrenula ochraceoflavens]
MLTRTSPTRLCQSCRRDLLALWCSGLVGSNATPKRCLPQISFSLTKSSARNHVSLARRQESRDLIRSRRSLNRKYAAQAAGDEPRDETLEDGDSSKSRVATEAAEEDDQLLSEEEQKQTSSVHAAINFLRKGNEHPIEVARIAYQHKDNAKILPPLSEEELQCYSALSQLQALPGTQEIDDARSNKVALEEIVKKARNYFGASLPRYLLFEEELTIYRRLYGEPNVKDARDILINDAVADNENIEEDAGIMDVDDEYGNLFTENEKGELEAVDIGAAPVEETQTGPTNTIKDRNQDQDQLDGEDGPSSNLALSPSSSAEEVARLVNGQITQIDEEAYEGEPESNEDMDTPLARLHPLTALGKWKTPQTLFLPRESFVSPIGDLLRDAANTHIDETSNRLFGGKGLPHSTAVASPSSQIPQLPIPIHAAQHSMSAMEANIYLAAIMPGAYAALTSILVEVRKRLGTEWIRNLLQMDRGPRILDAGAGGAGIIAMREILKAEHTALNPEASSTDAPVGRATVLTGSSALRHCAAALLENTTFLPRLPDYVHVRDSSTTEDDRPPPPRKEYDVILAPHTLWHQKEEWLRKLTVQKLWSLLSPEGGVLILLEKGQPRGFEVIAGAREFILKRLLQNSPDSPDYIEDTDPTPEIPELASRSQGMIIAPCTNHRRCPMYSIPGEVTGRKDFCSFEQRYIRPQFLQRILKAKDRNHEDVKFSYVAFRKGFSPPPPLQAEPSPPIPVDQVIPSFAGFESLTSLSNKPSPSSPQSPEALTDPSAITSLFSHLPRLVYPPLKRRGHVTFDVCTPAARIERWVIPRSFSKVAYRDAKKAQWGDLWALGAKTRTERKLRCGISPKEKKKIDKQQREAEKRETQMMDEEEEENADGMEELGREAEEITKGFGREREHDESFEKELRKLRRASGEANKQHQTSRNEAAETRDAQASKRRMGVHSSLEDHDTLAEWERDLAPPPPLSPRPQRREERRAVNGAHRVRKVEAKRRNKKGGAKFARH